jgi:quinol monooxygenase YgiN
VFGYRHALAVSVAELNLEQRMIRHMVAFRLKHAANSAEEADFLAAASKLTEIAGVERFEAMRQVSSKNDYTFVLSMEFADQAAYDHYNRHADHVAFVRYRWLREVEKFMEIDTVALAT